MTSPNIWSLVKVMQYIANHTLFCLIWIFPDDDVGGGDTDGGVQVCSDGNGGVDCEGDSGN